MFIVKVGSICFGLIVGWITYRTIRNRERNPVFSDITAIVGALGGGTIASLASKGELYFPWYCVGLAGGFFFYLIIMVPIISRGNPNSEFKKYL
jgi:uncharacterized membrane protein YeaQ/YmgE (transglycosylase-associated protein family)